MREESSVLQIKCVSVPAGTEIYNQVRIRTSATEKTRRSRQDNVADVQIAIGAANAKTQNDRSRRVDDAS